MSQVFRAHFCRDIPNLGNRPVRSPRSRPFPLSVFRTSSNPTHEKWAVKSSRYRPILRLTTPQSVLMSFILNGTVHHLPRPRHLGRFPRCIHRHIGQAMVRRLTATSKSSHAVLLSIHRLHKMSRMITRHFYLVTFVLYTLSCPSCISYSLSDPDEAVASVSQVSLHSVSSFASFPLPFYPTTDPSLSSLQEVFRST